MKENVIGVTVIAHDGKKTIANVVNKNGMAHGSAYCRKGDEYKPEIGAVIALCKAYGRDPGELCYDVMSVLAHKAGTTGATEEDKPDEKTAGGKVRKKGVPAGRIRSGALRLRTPVEDMGVPGTPTKFKDVNGKSLFVGDLVSVSVLDGDVRTGRKWEDTGCLAFVVDEQSENEYSKGQYIMGMLSACNAKTGKIDGRCRVRLAKRWQEVEVGETHGRVSLVWEEKHE